MKLKLCFFSRGKTFKYFVLMVVRTIREALTCKWSSVRRSWKDAVTDPLPGVLQPAGLMELRMAVNAAQHKIVNLLKILWDFFVIMSHNVFNVWPKTLFFVWPRDTKRLDTPVCSPSCTACPSNGKVGAHWMSLPGWTFPWFISLTPEINLLSLLSPLTCVGTGLEASVWPVTTAFLLML